MENWLLPSLTTILKVLFTLFCIFSAMLLITKFFGLRTFAKMSSLDFASTIAIGSVLAAVILNTNTSIIKGVVVLFLIVLYQYTFSLCKRKFSFFGKLLTNDPLLLMKDGKFIDKNLKSSNISKDEIYAKMREANVKSIKEVLAIVLESTGDVSVIHTSNNQTLEEEILSGVAYK